MTSYLMHTFHDYLILAVHVSCLSLSRSTNGGIPKSEALRDPESPDVPGNSEVGSNGHLTPDLHRGLVALARSFPSSWYGRLPLGVPFSRYQITWENAMSSVAIRLRSLRCVSSDSERGGGRVHDLPHKSGHVNHPLLGPCRANRELIRRARQESTKREGRDWWSR
jgi:hypothetical protein